MLTTILAFVLVAALSMLAGVLLVLWWAVPRLENLFVFRPSAEVSRTPAELGIPFEQHFIDTRDGCRLSAWHIVPEEPRAAVIYFHGNGGNLGILNEIFALFYSWEIQVLAVDYRGYGWSSGRPSEKGLHEDARACVCYFVEKLRQDGIPLLYWGRSLGGWVAASAASHTPPDGLILETAFSSKRSLMRHYPRFRPFHLFSRCRLDTAAYLKDQMFPVLLVHGNRDRTVPLEEGRRLYESLTGPKEFFCIEGADHINLHRLDTDRYRSRVLQFMESLRPPTIH